MPDGTESPKHWPANTGPHTSTGVKYHGMEARAAKILNLYLTDYDDTFSVAATAPSVGDNEFTALAGHSITTGDTIMIYEDDVYFQCQVLNVVINTITIDTPIPYAFTVAGAAGINGVRNANVDGSVTPVTYKIEPPPGQIWDITKTSIYLEGDTAAMTHTLFGDIAALTNGVVLQVSRRSVVKYEVLLNAKANIDFMRSSGATKVQPSMTALAFGLHSFKTYGNEAYSGAMIRLDGDQLDKLEFVVQDDLTSLVLVKIKAQGYFLKEE